MTMIAVRSRSRLCLALVLSVFIHGCLHQSHGWVPQLPGLPSKRSQLCKTGSRSRQISNNNNKSALWAFTKPTTVSSLESELQSLIANTDRGRKVSDKDKESIEKLLTRIEAECPSTEPARSPLVEGLWTVLYTTSPPPSNGQLGPFLGISQQEINLSTGTYKNFLRVSPNDWLAATLAATYEEWDGVYLKDDKKKKKKDNSNDDDDDDQDTTATASSESANAAATSNEDYGATCWVVTFQTLTIKLFGFPLVNIKFDNTQRVWRTTYVDQDTRILQAGRTGERGNESVFYMKRGDLMD